MRGATGPTGLTALTEPTSPIGPTGPTGPEGFAKLRLKNYDSNQAYYLYPDGTPAQAQLQQFLRFYDRDLLYNENAWAGVYLTRNEDLISSGPLGPTGVPGATGPIPTNPQFVYQTPLVRFVNKFTPLITNQNPISVAEIGTTGVAARAARPLDAYLADLFDALLDLGPGSASAGTYLLKVGASYGYPLATARAQTGPTDQTELLASTPLLLRPSVEIGPDTKPAFVRELSTAIRTWVADNHLARDVGKLVFQITVFSGAGEVLSPGPREFVSAAIAAGATGITQPILVLENLQLNMADVDWEEDGPCR